MQSNPDDILIELFICLSQHIDALIANNHSHSSRVANHVMTIAKHMGMSEQEIYNAFWASLFHDIGKIGIPDEVLVKEGPLSYEEWMIIKLHPTVGANIVNMISSLSEISPIIRAHQEKYDGSGYPKGLSGEEIPLAARILAVADAYDAITNDRVYRPARSIEEGISELTLMKNQHFDPEIVELFIKVLADESIN